MNDLLKLTRGIFGKRKEKRSILDHCDGVHPKGKPLITVRDRDGNIVEQFEGDNLVVRRGRSSLIKALTGDMTTGFKITKMQLGKGGVTALDPWTAIDVNIEDISLTTPIAGTDKNIIGFEYVPPLAENPYPMECIFSCVYSSAEVNEIVSEVILIQANGTVYARYTFPAVYLKNDKGYSLEINWTSKFN